MTNFEWLKEEINKMNMEEIFNFRDDSSPWCEDTCGERKWCPHTTMSCSDCAIEWGKKLHKEPMPELKTGMFVEYYDKHYENSPSIYNARGYGVVVVDKIICQDGSCFYGLKDEDTINCITKIFNADYFNDCDDDTCIWERN